MPSITKFTPMKDWEWGTADMRDRTCADCERLLQAYVHATQCQLIIECDAARDRGLEALARKASNRCEEARKAFEDHEATHIRATAVARATS